jgi:hypothetical protein
MKIDYNTSTVRELLDLMPNQVFAETLAEIVAIPISRDQTLASKPYEIIQGTFSMYFYKVLNQPVSIMMSKDDFEALLQKIEKFENEFN